MCTFYFLLMHAPKVYRFIRLMSTERTLYKYLAWPMGFSLRQANLFMCKTRAISRGRRAAGYWNNIPGPGVRLSSQKLPARLGGTLCYYLACNFFAAAKRALWAEYHQSCYGFIIKRTYLPDEPVFLLIESCHIIINFTRSSRICFIRLMRVQGLVFLF
jgi:hypothetical protein